MRVILTVAVGIGVLTGVLLPMPVGAQLIDRLLGGLCVGMVAFSTPLLSRIFRRDPSETAARFASSDPGRTLVDVVITLAGVGGLIGVGAMLWRTARPDLQVFEALLSVGVVASCWVAIHTVYTLRYARQYFASQPDCIDFGPHEPALSDFAYLSFTLGMTYQVSDTDLRTSEVRKIVLEHTLISYIFGAVIIAATINLIAGLAT